MTGNNGRLESNGQDRVRYAGGQCEAHGLHHPDCEGIGTIIHHVYRRQDTVPHNVDRNDTALLRWVWNGPTKLGAGGCHQRIHQNQDQARELGLLAPRPVHTLTHTPLGWLTSTNHLIP